MLQSERNQSPLGSKPTEVSPLICHQGGCILIMSNMFHGVVKSPDGPGSVVSDGSMLQEMGEVISGLAISR
jgi:hypothetical protein